MCCKCHIHSKCIAFPQAVLMYEHPTILENLFIRLQCYTIKNLLHVVQKQAVKKPIRCRHPIILCCIDRGPNQSQTAYRYQLKTKLLHY